MRPLSTLSGVVKGVTNLFWKDDKTLQRERHVEQIKAHQAKALKEQQKLQQTANPPVAAQPSAIIPGAQTQPLAVAEPAPAPAPVQNPQELVIAEIAKNQSSFSLSAFYSASALNWMTLLLGIAQAQAAELLRSDPDYYFDYHNDTTNSSTGVQGDDADYLGLSYLTWAGIGVGSAFLTVKLMQSIYLLYRYSQREDEVRQPLLASASNGSSDQLIDMEDGNDEEFEDKPSTCKDKCSMTWYMAKYLLKYMLWDNTLKSVFIAEVLGASGYFYFSTTGGLFWPILAGTLTMNQLFDFLSSKGYAAKIEIIVFKNFSEEDIKNSIVSPKKYVGRFIGATALALLSTGVMVGTLINQISTVDAGTMIIIVPVGVGIYVLNQFSCNDLMNKQIILANEYRKYRKSTDEQKKLLDQLVSITDSVAQSIEGVARGIGSGNIKIAGFSGDTINKLTFIADNNANGIPEKLTPRAKRNITVVGIPAGALSLGYSCSAARALIKLDWISNPYIAFPVAIVTNLPTNALTARGVTYMGRGVAELIYDWRSFPQKVSHMSAGTLISFGLILLAGAFSWGSGFNLMKEDCGVSWEYGYVVGYLVLVLTCIALALTNILFGVEVPGIIKKDTYEALDKEDEFRPFVHKSVKTTEILDELDGAATKLKWLTHDDRVEFIKEKLVKVPAEKLNLLLTDQTVRAAYRAVVTKLLCGDNPALTTNDNIQAQLTVLGQSSMRELPSPTEDVESGSSLEEHGTSPSGDSRSEASSGGEVDSEEEDGYAYLSRITVGDDTSNSSASTQNSTNTNSEGRADVHNKAEGDIKRSNDGVSAKALVRQTRNAVWSSPTNAANGSTGRHRFIRSDATDTVGYFPSSKPTSSREPRILTSSSRATSPSIPASSSVSRPPSPPPTP